MKRKEGGNKIEREKEGGGGEAVARTLRKLHEVSFVILTKTTAFLVNSPTYSKISRLTNIASRTIKPQINKPWTQTTCGADDGANATAFTSREDSLTVGQSNCWYVGTRLLTLKMAFAKNGDGERLLVEHRQMLMPAVMSHIHQKSAKMA